MARDWQKEMRQEWLEVWGPYLAVNEPDGDGEWIAHCPVHSDRNPSARVNFDIGVWYCHACGEGGPIEMLWVMLTERMANDWLPPWVPQGSYRQTRSKRKRASSGAVEAIPGPETLRRWHEDLMSNKDAVDYLRFYRGLTLEEVRKRTLIGKVDQSGTFRYGFPVYDAYGDLVNIRYYVPPSPSTPKRVFSMRGRGTARLYPIDVLLDESNYEIALVEGEFDALLLNAWGVPAITSTGGAGKKKWKDEWSELFEGKRVYIIPDCDLPGIAYAQDALDSISEYADVCIVRLPYEVQDDGGDDVSDYLVRDSRQGPGIRIYDLRKLMRQSWRYSQEEDMRLDPNVQDRIRGMHIRDYAEKEWRKEKMFSHWDEPPSAQNLDEELSIPLPPLEFTVSGLHPHGGNTLLRSGYKVGKSTLLLNLVRSLADGEPFLGEYEVLDHGGNIAFWNYEVSRHQFREWLIDLDVNNSQKVSPLTLRGYNLALDVDELFDWAVQWLREREIGVLIIDPFSRAFGMDENDNSSVGEWLDMLDMLKQEAGVHDLFMSAHFGRGHEERARGATRLEDWPDSLWLLAEMGQYRYFSAMGRDVDAPERKLGYNEATRVLKVIGGSRNDEIMDMLTNEIVAIIGSGGEPTQRQVLDGLTAGSSHDKARALSMAEENGIIVVDRTIRPFRCKLA